MSPRFSTRETLGHSLIELVAAMVCSVVLLAGLGSVMLIARQIAYIPTAAAERVTAAKAVNQIVEELRFATWIVEYYDNAIEFVVVDRDGDGAAERIRYEWDGSPGDPIVRTLNGGAPVTFVEDVDNFELSYLLDTETVQLTPSSEGAEVVLASNATVQANGGRSINSDNQISQQINPATFASAPVGATGWIATRVDFYGRNSGSLADVLYVQLRSSGNPRHGPTSEVLGDVFVPESTISGSSGWNSVSFSNPIRGLYLNRRYNLVWAGSNSNVSCQLSYADTTPTGVSESSDGGASWQYSPSRMVFYRLYGKYVTLGAPVDVTRSYLATVDIMLQTADAAHGRIDAGVSLVNRPDFVSAAWRVDFNSDPTAIDVAGDGVADWVRSDGNSFDTDSLDDGVWTVDTPIETRPLSNFTNVTTINARCRDGAVLRINADRESGTHGPIIVRVTPSSGMQTLTLAGETAVGDEKALTTVERLANDWIQFQLLIVPQQNIVQLKVQDREVGSYVYPTYATTTADRFLSLSGTNADFDYVEVLALNNCVVELAD